MARLARLALLLTVHASATLLGGSAAAQCMTNKLRAAGTHNGFFGEEVSASGDRIAVGFGIVGELVQIHVRDGSNWYHEADLTDGTARPDRFGVALALEGDRLFVGAETHKGGNKITGAVHVFENAAGTWTRSQLLRPSDRPLGGNFGTHLDADGDLLVVGANLEDTLGFHAGAVYVFERQGGVWSEVQKLHGSDTAAGDQFGAVVAIAGDTLLVSAPQKPAPGATSGRAGAAYVFERIGGAWVEVQKLLPSDLASNDGFGWRLDLTQDTAIVGAFRAATPALGSGAAYVFDRIGGAWTETQKLLPPAPATNGLFGLEVHVENDLAVIGEPELVTGTGRVHVFQRSGGAWRHRRTVSPEGGYGDDAFGSSIDVDGDALVVGAWGHNWPNGLYTLPRGAVWVGSRSGSSCATLTAHPESLSLAVARTQTLRLDAGPEHAGRPYWILGSMSGTTPGIVVGGRRVPLNPDAYLARTFPPSPASPVSGASGILDALGRADAAVRVPLADTSLAGLVLEHAFLVLDPDDRSVAHVSNVTPLWLFR